MSSLTIGKKLYTGVAVLSVLTFILGITAFVSVGNIGDNVHRMTSSTLKKQQLAHRLDYDAADLLADDRGILVRGFMKDVPTVEKYNQQFVDTTQDIRSALAEIQPLVAA